MSFGSWGFKGRGRRGLELPRGDEVEVSQDGRARLRYNHDLLRLEQSINGGAWEAIGGAGAGGGTIYVTDITPQGSGIVSDKVYQDAGSTVLRSCTTSETTIRVEIIASYPLVRVGGTLATLIRSADEGHYSGTVDVTIAGTGQLEVTVISPDDEAGSSNFIEITLDTPPELLTLQFTGSYPGAQTELKENDTIQLTGTTDKPCTGIRVLDYQAGKFYEAAFAATTSFTVSIPIADRGDVAVLRPARAQVKNAVGAYGSTRDTNQGGGTVELVNLVRCNNLYPTVTIGAITYPGAQTALKGAETATVAMTTADLDTILYTSPNGDLSITNPTLDEATKTVQRIAGSYNISTTNLRATANRAANDSTTVDNGVVAIANVAATITVSEPAARLISGGNDGTAPQDHTITLSSSQQLLNAPTLNEQPGGGTFLGVWAGGPSTWTRSLRVLDTDTKGTYTYQGLVATNRAGIVTNVITGDSQYVLGGFVSRSLTIAPFGTTATVNVAAVDFSKVTCTSWSFTAPAAFNKQPIGTPPSVPDGWTISALAANPHTFIILDTAKAAASSQASTINGYREDP